MCALFPAVSRASFLLTQDLYPVLVFVVAAFALDIPKLREHVAISACRDLVQLLLAQFFVRYLPSGTLEFIAGTAVVIAAPRYLLQRPARGATG
jgi:hypothetical protein